MSRTPCVSSAPGARRQHPPCTSPGALHHCEARACRSTPAASCPQRPCSSPPAMPHHASPHMPARQRTSQHTSAHAPADAANNASVRPQALLALPSWGASDPPRSTCNAASTSSSLFLALACNEHGASGTAVLCLAGRAWQGVPGRRCLAGTVTASAPPVAATAAPRSWCCWGPLRPSKRRWRREHGRGVEGCVIPCDLNMQTGRSPY